MFLEMTMTSDSDSEVSQNPCPVLFTDLLASGQKRAGYSSIP